ncbi:MAG: isoprenylcysteine carboxylmethyltransferase family protein [Acidobacteria bacterium]|nr:isoprenylcysteine carboxylmethyltransferase family protein [Acidobacteriota bacterium]
MPLYCYLIVVGGIALWLTPFVRAKWGDRSLVSRDTRTRWGLLLECLGVALILQTHFWSFSPPWWRVAASLLCLVLANALSWTSARALGDNLRFDAAIGTKHELVRHGPYSIVRHPIYTSFLCILWGIGLMAAPLWLFVAATAVFLSGTEIRVRIEDRLLEEHFGDEARQYRRSTSAYIPFLR